MVSEESHEVLCRSDRVHRVEGLLLEPLRIGNIADQDLTSVNVRCQVWGYQLYNPLSKGILRDYPGTDLETIISRVLDSFKNVQPIIALTPTVK